MKALLVMTVSVAVIFDAQALIDKECGKYSVNYYQKASCLEHKREVYDSLLAQINEAKPEIRKATHLWHNYIIAECDFYGTNENYGDDYLPYFEACKLNESKLRWKLLSKPFKYDFCGNPMTKEKLAHCLKLKMQKEDRMLRGLSQRVNKYVEEYDRLKIDNKLQHAEELWRLYIEEECRSIALVENKEKDDEIYFTACLVKKTEQRIDELKHFINKNES